MSPTCPNENTLRQFNEGRIVSDSEIDRIAEHLGECERCVDALESMQPGPIATGLRESASDFAKSDITRPGEEDLSLESVRESIDHALSNIGSLLPDQEKLGENRYQMIAAVGEGTFSCVYGALRQTDSELVGIKIPHSKKLSSFRHAEQFFDDCVKARSLDHPNIQPVFEFGHWDEQQIYLAKPLVQHPTLTTYAKAGSKLTVAEMEKLFEEILTTIEFAHHKNILHRHLSPNNIHLHVENGQKNITICDFGFVLDSRYHFDLIEPDAAESNPFVSPESATLNSQYVDVRSDIFSLGKILKLLARITSSDDSSSSTAASDDLSDASLGKIVKKSTSTRRRDRYQTISEFKSDWDAR